MSGSISRSLLKNRANCHSPHIWNIARIKGFAKKLCAKKAQDQLLMNDKIDQVNDQSQQPIFLYNSAKYTVL